MESRKKLLKRNDNHEHILRNEFKKSEFFFRYGYFYYPFKQRAFFYELIYLMRRNIFILFDIFLIPLVRVQDKYNPTLFLILAIIIIWCFYLAQNKIQPYRKEINRMNNLESLSLVTLIFSYLFGVLVLADFKENSLDLDKNQRYTLQFFFSLILFGIMIFVNTGS